MKYKNKYGNRFSFYLFLVWCGSRAGGALRPAGAAPPPVPPHHTTATLNKLLLSKGLAGRARQHSSAALHCTLPACLSSKSPGFCSHRTLHCCKRAKHILYSQ